VFSHVTKRLSAYCNGELSPAEVQQVEAHLSGCARCREELEEIRLGVALASHLEKVPAPESLWQRIEAQLSGTDNREQDSVLPLWQDWRAWGVAAAVFVLAVWLGVRWTSPQPVRAPVTRGGTNPPSVIQPAVYDLGEYIRPVQAAKIDTSYQPIWNAPPRFVERKRDQKFPSEWLNKVLAGPPPLPDYQLSAVRSGSSDGAPITQLVYTKDGEEAFSVFVAPRHVQFKYGKEHAYEAEVDGVWCRRVDCPLQRTFEFGEGGFKCVLVSKSMDDRTAAKVMSFFLAAYKQPPSE